MIKDGLVCVGFVQAFIENEDLVPKSTKDTANTKSLKIEDSSHSSNESTNYELQMKGLIMMMRKWIFRVE